MRLISKLSSKLRSKKEDLGPQGFTFAILGSIITTLLMLPIIGLILGFDNIPTSRPSPTSNTAYYDKSDVYIIVSIFDGEIVVSKPEDVIDDVASVWMIKLDNTTAYSVGDFVDRDGSLIINGDVAYKAYGIANRLFPDNIK